MLFFLSVAHLWAAEGFRYRYRSGENYQVISDVRQKVFVNNRLSHSSTFENRISVQVIDTNQGAGLLDARYRVIEQSERDAAIRQVSRESAVRYWRDDRGNSRVPSDSFVPLVRGIPSFPDKKPQVGNSWTAPAQEVFDLRGHCNIPRPYPVDILVRYTYLGEKPSPINQENYPAIAISYSIDHSGRANTDANRAIPVRVRGLSRQEMLWDSVHGRPHSYRDQYRLEFVLTDGRRLRVVGEAEGYIHTAVPMERQDIKQDIQERLQEAGLEETEVDTAAEGVRINLEHILFHPDSDRLLPGEDEKIATIATILQRYNHRDKLIVGHTAEVGNAAGQQRLSERRAEVVALLLQRSGIENIITQGKGARSPVADNRTPAGRRKNRRVEILILEN